MARAFSVAMRRPRNNEIWNSIRVSKVELNSRREYVQAGSLFIQGVLIRHDRSLVGLDDVSIVPHDPNVVIQVPFHRDREGLFHPARDHDWSADL
jgi:hypothetical protein